MPFVITTYEPVPTGVEHMGAVEMTREPVSRRAFATLEEARANVAALVPDEIDLDCWASFSLSESGGTVALPDGTLIEVAPRTWEELAHDKRAEGWPDDLPAEYEPTAAQRAIITAYNAAQS
jgi:hypothetical protein